jgi:hypothetical protein
MNLSCAFCDTLGAFANLLPLIPSSISIGGFISSFGDAFPLVGTGILVELFHIIKDILFILASLKISLYVRQLFLF